MTPPDRSRLERVVPGPEYPEVRERSGMVVVYLAAILVIVVLAIYAAASRGPAEPDSTEVPAEQGSGGGRVVRPALGAPQSPTVSPVANAGTGLSAAPRLRGWASWCADTGEQCQGWDDKYLGAVPSFSYGDEPYMAQVCRVDDPLRCTHVLVVSFCACGPRRGDPTVIDLSPPAFRELAPLSSGIVRVTVDRGAAPTLPATETKP